MKNAKRSLLKIGFVSTFFAINLFCLIAKASTAPETNCVFISNEEAQGLFSAEPSATIGAVTCADYKEASSLMVLQLKQIDEKTLSAAVIEIAKIAHPNHESALVTWKSTQPLESRQLIVTTTVAKTDHSNTQVMLHYAFVAKELNGSFLVFVHSAPEKETHALHQTLEALYRELRNPKFLSQIRVGANHSPTTESRRG